MLETKKSIESQFPETKVKVYAASITDTKRSAEIVNEIGTIDVLVLNAAYMHTPAPTADINLDETRESFEINVVGPLNLVRAFINLAPRTEGAKRTISYVSTAGVSMPRAGTTVYSASKGAMTYLMRSIASEYESAGIRAFTFHPAIAFTDMAKDVMGLKEDQFSYDSCKLSCLRSCRLLTWY
jgi:NAD(P)-dependent dehydrogenase (short-subunit alcohol dehydrogenase family)